MNLYPDRKVKVDERDRPVHIRPRTIENFFEAMAWAGVHNPKGSSVRGTNAFCKTKTIHEYVEMLRDGWQAGIQDMQELEGITSDAAEKQSLVRNVGGAFPVVPAYLAGQPDSMLQSTLVETDNVRGLTLVIDSCFAGYVSATTILEYAKTVMRLVAWLQAQRIDTSVYSVIPIRLGSKRVVYTTPIRQTGQTFQPERIAAVLHPSWLRRAWFAMMEYEFKECFIANGKKRFPECKAIYAGYGSVTRANAAEMREALPEAYSVIMLPKPGDGDPKRAVEETLNLKIRF